MITAEYPFYPLDVQTAIGYTDSPIHIECLRSDGERSLIEDLYYLLHARTSNCECTDPRGRE